MSRIATIKYSLKTSLVQISPFYYTLGAIFILYLILKNVTVGEASLGQWDALAAFVAIAIPVGFRERFHFFLQNGYSRKTLFLNFILCFFIISGFMALAEALIVQLSNLLDVSYQPLFNQMYGARYILGDYNMAFEGLLYHFTIFIGMMGIFFPLTIAYYRLPKFYRILCFIVIPMIIFLGIPIMDGLLFDANIMRSIWMGFLKLIGLYEDCNPLISCITFSIAGIVGMIVSYFLIQRVNIQK